MHVVGSFTNFKVEEDEKKKSEQNRTEPNQKQSAENFFKCI